MEFLFVILGIPLLLLITDWLGWTAAYRKRDRAHSIIGAAMLGADHLFAQKDRQQAIEYRLGQKGEVTIQTSEDDKNVD